MIYRCKVEKKGNQLNEFGTMERGIEEVGNCGRVDIHATWELFSFGGHIFVLSLLRYRKYLFSENQRVLCFKCRFYTNSSRLFVPRFSPFFSFPFSHTVLSSSVDHLRLCNSAHKAWDGGMGPLFSMHTSSTLHIV